eukprot:452992_1
MSIELLFKTLYCTFDAPTSTTTAESTACNFGGGAGIVMKLESSESTRYIKTLDMDLFTCFHNEEEHLIFETRLHIKDIWLQKSGEWVGNSLMNTFSLYDLCIHGNDIHEQRLLKKKPQRALVRMMECVMSNKITTYTKSNYVNKLVESLVEKNNKIWLNIQQIMSLSNTKLQNMFIAEDGKSFGDYIEYLKNHSSVIICPIFMTNWTMNNHTFDIITRSYKYNNVEVVVKGPIIKCVLSDNKSIVFQPRLTKTDNIFDVEMKFISAYNNLRINVHFDVSYQNVDTNYYTSLHPRIMDIKWNNTFHVALPVTTQCENVNEKSSRLNLCCHKKKEQSETISISMSVMIHNVDQFEINYNDFSATNHTIMADMTASAQSYTFPDII